MLISWLAVIGGLLLLVWSADKFVMGASATARNLGISPLVIGMTIMGFGTSAPEMLVSSMAAINGNPALGIGNALGSNIANIGLVLGITAMIMPLSVSSGVLRREYPALVVVTLLSGALLLDGVLGVLDGLILLASAVAMILWLIWISRAGRQLDPLAAELSSEIPTAMSSARALMWTLLGLLLLVISARLLVWGAVAIAQYWGVSDLVIGLTIIAIGTSLPELAASAMSAYKQEDDLAVGNIIGSNMFNLLAVLPLPGLIKPSVVDAWVLQRDIPVMIGLTFALFVMAYGFRGPGRINRFEGGLLFMIFVAYMVWLGKTGLS